MPRFVYMTTTRNEKVAVNVDQIMAVVPSNRDASYTTDVPVKVTVVVLTGQLCYDVQGTVEEVMKTVVTSKGAGHESI